MTNSERGGTKAFDLGKAVVVVVRMAVVWNIRHTKTTMVVVRNRPSCGMGEKRERFLLFFSN